MCGIAGIYNRDEPADQTLLLRMINAMVHRWPDDEGYYLRSSVGLGMRRLSIIDLAGGHQPMGNEDGALQIVFNGEIYNYRELQAEITARGYRLATRSDTEVIVHLYEEFGAGCLNRLNCMFAFAIGTRRGKSCFSHAIAWRLSRCTTAGMNGRWSSPLRPVSDTELTVELMDGWVAPGYGLRRSAQVMRVRYRGRLPARVDTVIEPASRPQTPRAGRAVATL